MEILLGALYEFEARRIAKPAAYPLSKSVIQYPSSLLRGNPLFEITMNDEAQRQMDEDIEENAELYEALADESDE